MTVTDKRKNATTNAALPCDGRDPCVTCRERLNGRLALSVDETAAAIGISRAQTYVVIGKRDLVARKIESSTRVLWWDLIDYLDSRPHLVPDQQATNDEDRAAIAAEVIESDDRNDPRSLGRQITSPHSTQGPTSAGNPSFRRRRRNRHR